MVHQKLHLGVTWILDHWTRWETNFLYRRLKQHMRKKDLGTIHPRAVLMAGKEKMGELWLLLLIVIIGSILILGSIIVWYFYRKHKVSKQGNRRNTQHGLDLKQSDIFLWTPVEDYVNQHLPKPNFNHGAEEAPIERKPTILIPEIPASQEKQAILSFSPRQSDEISIHLGDRLTIQRTYDDGWVMGHNTRSNISGMFPSTVFSAS
jgi:hypothetical protein